MTDKPIILTATFVADSEADAQELFRILKAVVAPSRAEEGCINYHVYRDKEHPLRFTCFEVFKNQKAFEFHLKQPHLSELLKRKAEVHFYEESSHG